MPPTPEPVHLSSHHRETLLQIFQHPAGHNIEWRAVLSLLEAVASVEESHDGRFLVTLGPETETFERPRRKDIDAATGGRPAPDVEKCRLRVRG